MNPSYLRLRRPLAEALERYGAWIGVPELEPPREVAERDAIDLASSGDEWKGLAVYIFSAGPWTVFEELSGGLGSRPAEDWLRLADGGDLVYAAYNDAIGYAELVRIDAGRLKRHFLNDEQDPSDDVDVGSLPGEPGEPFGNWVDAAQWVDHDQESLALSERGLLWIHRSP